MTSINDDNEKVLTEGEKLLARMKLIALLTERMVIVLNTARVGNGLELPFDCGLVVLKASTRVLDESVVSHQGKHPIPPIERFKEILLEEITAAKLFESYDCTPVQKC
jgi:hypothetical protein